MVGKTVMVAVGFMVLGQSSPPSDADWAWLDEHRDKAFEALMPVASAPRQLVAYRSYRDLYHDVPEVHFTIGIAEGAPPGAARLTAVVTSPTSGSIQQQLLRLHMSDRERSLDALLRRVTIQRQALSEERCPSIRSRLNALATATIALPDPNVVSLHPIVHRLVVDTGGVHIDARLVDSNDSVVRWAADTLKAFQRCKAG